MKEKRRDKQKVFKKVKIKKELLMLNKWSKEKKWKVMESNYQLLTVKYTEKRQKSKRIKLKRKR